MKILINLTLLCLFHGLYAQEKDFKELHEAINNAPTIEDRISRIRDVSHKYINQQIYYDSAFFYAKMAYEEALENNLTKLASQSLFDQASILQNVEEFEKSLELYEQCVQYSVDNNIINGVAHAYINMGVIYSDEYNDYDKALKYHKKTLAIATETKDDFIAAYAYMNIGDQYLKKKQPKTALEYIEKGTVILKKLGEETSDTKVFLANAHYQLNNTPIAKENALEALSMAQKEGNIQSAYDGSVLLKKIFKEEKNYLSSLEYSEKSFIYKDSIVMAIKLNEIEKLNLNFKLKEQNIQLEKLVLRNKYVITIYIIAALAVILLIFLIFKQVKIVRMTKEIHNMQKKLYEEAINKGSSKNASTLDAARSADKELK